MVENKGSLAKMLRKKLAENTPIQPQDKFIDNNEPSMVLEADSKPEPKIIIPPKPKKIIEPKAKPKVKEIKVIKKKEKCEFCGKLFVNLKNHKCKQKPKEEQEESLIIPKQALANVKPYTKLRFIAELLGTSGGSGKKKSNLKREVKDLIDISAAAAKQEIDNL